MINSLHQTQQQAAGMLAHLRNWLHQQPAQRLEWAGQIAIHQTASKRSAISVSSVAPARATLFANDPGKGAS